MNRFSTQYQLTNPFLAQRAVYRYGFQAQEQDRELWEGAVSFKYRVEDARLGRFFSVDFLSNEYPWNSPFAFSENRLLDGVELEGKEFAIGATLSWAGRKVNTQEKAINMADSWGLEGLLRTTFLVYSGAGSNLVPDLDGITENIQTRFDNPSSSISDASLFVIAPVIGATKMGVDYLVSKGQQVYSIFNEGSDIAAYQSGALCGELALIGLGARQGSIKAPTRIGLNTVKKTTLQSSSRSNLGNPFKKYTLKEIEAGFENKVREGSFELKYVDPISASRSYKNLKSGYSYNLDTGISGKTGAQMEAPHVDVNYPNPKPKNVEPKRKFETKTE